MLLSKVKVGEVYLAIHYGRIQSYEWPPRDGAMWQRIGERGYPLKVLAAPVDVPSYTRRGVEGQQLNRDTMEPQTFPDGRVAEPVRMMAVSLLMPWAEFFVAYHEFLDAEEEEHERRRVQREQRDARLQEKAARDWMEREFARARQDIERVAEVCDLGDSYATDVNVQRLVDLRNPDGNPYLNGERTAHG